MGAPGPPKELRIESNKPGTAFCLDGAPLLSSDTRVSVHAGDRVYVVKPAPDKEVTIVAAKDGYFPFTDKVTREKIRMQFEFYERNSCTRSSAGRTCITPAIISDLNAFRQFCKKYP